MSNFVTGGDITVETAVGGERPFTANPIVRDAKLEL